MDSLMLKKMDRAADHLRMNCVMKKMMEMMIRMALTSRTKRYVMPCHVMSCHVMSCYLNFNMYEFVRYVMIYHAMAQAA